MAIQRKHRGFTRLDALVVAAVCLAFVLLVPVLHAMTQEHYFRTVCAARIAEIGKTMFVYANDNETALPRAGGPTTSWGLVENWQAPTRQLAFGTAADGRGGRATISSSFYLVVKYCEARPRLFLCPGDKGTTEFEVSDAGVSADFELARAWDFGPAQVSSKSCSFSYHLPYGGYALTTSRDPNLAVAADRNPWFPSPAAAPASFAEFAPDLPGYAGATPSTARVGNAVAHGKDGQNVLFLEGGVTFEGRPYCGVNKDNIFTTGPSSKGMQASTLSSPGSEEDSLLVHDPHGPIQYRPVR